MCWPNRVNSGGGSSSRPSDSLQVVAGIVSETQQLLGLADQHTKTRCEGAWGLSDCAAAGTRAVTGCQQLRACFGPYEERAVHAVHAVQGALPSGAHSSQGAAASGGTPQLSRSNWRLAVLSRMRLSRFAMGWAASVG